MDNRVFLIGVFSRQDYFYDFRRHPATQIDFVFYEPSLFWAKGWRCLISGAFGLMLSCNVFVVVGMGLNATQLKP